MDYNGDSILNYGDVSTLSFHATKVFNTIEGGGLVAKDGGVKNKIHYLRNFGFNVEKDKMNIESVVLPGINGKMSELHAAVGIENLKLLISLPIELGNIADAIGRDSKSGWKRYLKLVDCLDEIIDVVRVDYAKLKLEVQDLNEVEKIELQAYIATKFDIANENLEIVIEKSLAILEDASTLVINSIELFKNNKK